MTSPPPVGATSRVRPEIQALRALAVGAVVLYHFWPALAPAGYMGVDVFFVVSGFLITGILLRQAGAGRLSLLDFYKRRIRRILPAAMVVLLVCAVLTVTIVPMTRWGQNLREVVTSTFYVQNWQLATDSQIPRRADLVSSPVQHFWSLSVEEQFYLVWPLLILVALFLASRLRRAHTPVILVVLGVVTIASFVHNVVLTAQDHNLAYFSTFARAWEFGVGGLLALFPAVAAERLVRFRSVVSWVGLVAIVVPIVLFRDTAVFPGWVVLAPVLGTLAVIWAGSPRPVWSTRPVASLPPVQWLGDISYSLYLWHWPVVWFTPYITGVPSPTPVMLVLLVVSLLLAWASKVWIEDPIRFGRRGHSRPRIRTVLAGLVVGSLLIVGTASAGTWAKTLAKQNLRQSVHSASPGC